MRMIENLSKNLGELGFLAALLRCQKPTPLFFRKIFRTLGPLDKLVRYAINHSIGSRDGAGMEKEFYKALQRIAGELERCNDTRQVCLTVLDEMLGFSQAEAGCALEASPEGVRVVERQGYSSFELDVAAVSQLPLVQRLVQTNEPYLLADRQADPDDWYASPQDFQSWLGGIAWIDVQRYVLFHLREQRDSCICRSARIPAGCHLRAGGPGVQ
jgi:hypothetical protein